MYFLGLWGKCSSFILEIALFCGFLMSGTKFFITKIVLLSTFFNKVLSIYYLLICSQKR